MPNGKGMSKCKQTRRVRVMWARTQHDVAEHRHLDVTDSDTQAEDLLQLELDSRTDFVEFVREILGVRDGCGEFAGCIYALKSSSQ